MAVVPDSLSLPSPAEAAKVDAFILATLKARGPLRFTQIEALLPKELAGVLRQKNTHESLTRLRNAEKVRFQSGKFELWPVKP